MQKTKSNEIVRQKFDVDFDKNKNLVLTSIKIYANNRERKDTAKLTRAQVSELMRAKSRELFMHTLTKKFNVIEALKCDSKAKKARLCKNTAYCTTADNIASFLKLNAVKYVNAHSKTSKKSIKKSAKSAKSTRKVKTSKKS